MGLVLVTVGLTLSVVNWRRNARLDTLALAGLEHGGVAPATITAVADDNADTLSLAWDDDADGTNAICAMSNSRPVAITSV